MRFEGDGIEGEEGEIIFPRGTCVFCGKRADAVWWGNGYTRVCKQCAVDILPRLIADAMVNGDGTEYGEILEIFQALKAPFLEAALAQMTRARDKRRSE